MNLQDWMGRSETVNDVATPTPYASLSATLDNPSTARPASGTPLPQVWHWLHFLPIYVQSEIGEDDHAKRSSFMPPVPLPRRKWVGSDFEFHEPLIATLLIGLLRRQLPDAKFLKFEFKAVQPIFDIRPFSIHGQPSPDGRTVRLWGHDHEGWLTMDATATLK